MAIGQADGAGFVEIGSEGQMIYLGRLPQYSVPSQWREIRAYRITWSLAAKPRIMVFRFLI
jgi:hypothetical protein